MAVIANSLLSRFCFSFRATPSDAQGLLLALDHTWWGSGDQLWYYKSNQGEPCAKQAIPLSAFLVQVFAPGIS